MNCVSSPNKDILGHALIWNWIVWCGQVNVWHELELSKLHSVTRFAWDVQGVTWVIYKLQYFRKLWDNTIVLIWSSQCKSFWLIPPFLHLNLIILNVTFLTLFLLKSSFLLSKNFPTWSLLMKRHSSVKPGSHLHFIFQMNTHHRLIQSGRKLHNSNYFLLTSF